MSFVTILALGLSLLVAAPGAARSEDFAKELEQGGVSRSLIKCVGSHASRFELNEARSGVFAPEN